MKASNTLRALLFFVLSIMSANPQANYKPRKLTASEVKSSPKHIQLEHLLSSSDKSDTQIDSSSEEAGPISHLAKGTNQEPGPKDAIRYNTSA